LKDESDRRIWQNLDNCIGESGKKASHRCSTARAVEKILEFRAEIPELKDPSQDLE
jgi:hypothetical protein